MTDATAPAQSAPATQSNTQPPEAEQQTRTPQGKFQGKASAPPAPAPSSSQLNQRAAKVGTPDPAAPPVEPVKPEPRKYKFKEKVYGKEEEVEYDEDSLVRALQKGKGADRRMQEASELEKKSQAMLRAIQTGDGEALKAFGIDLDALAESRMVERARRELVPKHELEAEELRAENARMKLERQQFELQQQRAQEEAKVDATWRELQPQFEKATEEFDLPRDHATMKLLAAVGDEFAAAGVDLTPRQIVAEVAKRQNDRIGRYVVGALKQSPEAIDRFLTKHGLKDGYLQHLSAADAKKRGLPQRREAAPAPEKPEPKKFIYSDSDWKKALRSGG